MATSKGGYVSGGFDILKAPNAPTITSVATGIGSASVAFTAPTDVGGGAITSYTITAVDESTGASTGAVGSASPITVSPGGGTFKIRAAATNIYGPGRVSQYETGKQIYSGATLWGWGTGTSGEIGDNTAVNRFSPVQVGALTDWSKVSKGENFSTAVKTNGTLWSWGSPANGKLGQNNTTTYLSSPVQVGALSDWYLVSSAGQSTCAIKTNGTLWSWGSNGSGRLGDGTVINRSSPVQIGSMTNWAWVSVGANISSTSHAVALKTDGTLWTWGSNNRGQLGQNNTIYRSSPVQVGALTNWSQVSAGSDFTFAIKTDGTLWAWGQNSNGQLGDSTLVEKSSPIQIGSLTDWAQVSAGSYSHTAAIKTNGTLWTWGLNQWGQGGRGNVVNSTSPIQVGALTNWRMVSAGYVLNTFVKTDGTMWSCGRNERGALGVGNTIPRSSPVQIGALTGWVSVSAASGGSQGAAALYGVV
jgi:alpha-tubulin suppressor-like RCC1 family protein